MKSLGCETAVSFSGWLEIGDVGKELRAADALVLTSRFDAFGVVVLEAMAAGKAVLATRVGGLLEFIEPPVNRLVEPTVDGLAKGLADWLNRIDKIKEYGERNVPNALKHSLSRMADQYLQTYHE